MTIEDTKEFMKRIKQHYQEFSVDTYKIKEWYRELEKYDLEDVNRKLDDHLRSERWGNEIPKLYFLTKYLITSKEKQSVKSYVTTCSNCGKVINFNNWDKHIERCNSVEYLNKQSMRFFGKEIDKEKYMNMGEEEFIKKYEMTLNKILDESKNKAEIKSVQNYFISQKGVMVEFDESIYKELGGKN